MEEMINFNKLKSKSYKFYIILTCIDSKYSQMIFALTGLWVEKRLNQFKQLIKNYFN